MNQICYPAIFHPEEEGYSVVVPDFDKCKYGCFTEGNTFEEACAMAFDAIGICVEDLIAEGKDIPVASKPENMVKDGNDFVVPIVFDFGAYKKQSKNLMIKKTLTIPEWLNDLAEEKNINFSQVLRTALANQLEVSL